MTEEFQITVTQGNEWVAKVEENRMPAREVKELKRPRDSETQGHCCLTVLPFTAALDESP